jgi:hypothetical protein
VLQPWQFMYMYVMKGNQEDDDLVGLVKMGQVEAVQEDK